MLLTTLSLALSMQSPWKLVWSDEFDKPGLPDPAKWTYETGFIANNEAQFYVKERKENSRIEKGRLIIEAHKDNFGGHPISSARLITRGKKEFTYGRVEVRAKVPTGRGTWPAIWFLGANISEAGWPACGEIDLMEHVGYDPNTVHFNIHTKAYNHMAGTNKGTSVEFPKNLDWHVYALEWYPDRLEFFLDGRKTFLYRKESDDPAVWPFNKPQFILLNLAIGGNWGGAKGIDDAIFPARFEVDYVRLYEGKK